MQRLSLLALCALCASGTRASTDGEFAERIAQLEGEQGKRLFARACAACHGLSGRGDGPAADDLRPRPRDLSTRQFRFRTTPSGALPRNEDLKRTIRRGIPGSSMPAFGDLFSVSELDALVAFVYALHGDPLEPAALDIAQPRTGTQPDEKEGRAIYLISGCWTCHGIKGDGRGPSSATLTDENDDAISLPDLRYSPFKAGHDEATLVRTLRTGLNGAPMPSYDEAMLFSREDYPLDSLPLERFAASDAETLSVYLDHAPRRASIEALAKDGRAALRDHRLAALARYLLSLDRRRGVIYQLFRNDPEKAGRE